MKFSKSVLLIIDNAIGQQLDTIDLAKPASAKLAVELLQARRDVRAVLAESKTTRVNGHASVAEYFDSVANG